MTLAPHTRLIIMGTPGFVLPTMERLITEKAENGENQFDLVAVYTRAPKPANRGELLYSPVHKRALELQQTYPKPFQIMTPETFKDEQNIKDFQAFKPDLVVVGAYGIILPQAVLDTPPMGCLNLHASLLPYGRGASPIQRSILDGKRQTGLTIMKMDAGCDTGLILNQASLPIEDTDTTDILCHKLSELGPDLLMKTLRENPEGQKQDDSQSTYAAKISKREAHIDWADSAEKISRQVRAFSSVPGAFTLIRDEKGRYLRLKIFNGIVDKDAQVPPEKQGVILENNGKIIVGCGAGTLELTDLQMEGKKRMNGLQFANGQILKTGDQLLNPGMILPPAQNDKKKILKLNEKRAINAGILTFIQHGRHSFIQVTNSEYLKEKTSSQNNQQSFRLTKELTKQR